MIDIVVYCVVRNIRAYETTPKKCTRDTVTMGNRLVSRVTRSVLHTPEEGDANTVTTSSANDGKGAGGAATAAAATNADGGPTTTAKREHRLNVPVEVTVVDSLGNFRRVDSRKLKRDASLGNVVMWGGIGQSFRRRACGFFERVRGNLCGGMLSGKPCIFYYGMSFVH